MRLIINVIFYFCLVLNTVDCFNNPQAMGNFEHLGLILGWFAAGTDAEELRNRVLNLRG